MPDHSGLDLLNEWQKSIRSLASSVAGHAEIPAQVLAPMQQSAGALHSQAEALTEPVRVLGQAASMMETQAELFERTIAVMRQPGEIVKRAAG